jgi:hypothetical protein
METTLERRYHDRLSNFPQPKQGRHQALLAAANLAIMAGISQEQVHNDLRKVAPDLPDREIHSAILKAASDHHQTGGTYRLPPKPAPLIKDGKAALKRIIGQGTIAEDVDLWEASPIRLYDTPEKDSALLLETLFPAAAFIFIGGKYEDGVMGQTIRTAAEWIVFFQAGGQSGPFIIINPFTGQTAPKKDGTGELSYRCDGSIAAYRHCLVEFDNLSREDQIRFWSAAKLPIRALIDTGGKSIHAWLDVSKLSNVTTADGWDRDIKGKLYAKVLKPFGVDSQCCNPSRLSRLPGYLRQETGKFQKILWLSKEGRRIVT